MYSDYRFLAPGVAQDDKRFSKLEAETYILASRNKDYYEICFLSAPYNPKGNNEVKFLQDDALVDMKTVSVLRENMPLYNKFQKTMSKFLQKNSTPTLAEFRQLNQELISEQEKANSADFEISM